MITIINDNTANSNTDTNRKIMTRHNIKQDRKNTDHNKQRIYVSPSTVHNIVKRFKESGEILVRKGQGWKPLSASDHRALRRYCLRNPDTTMMDIATWALEYFGQSVSLKSAAASRNTTLNCVMQKGRHLLILCRNTAEFSRPEVI